MKYNDNERGHTMTTDHIDRILRQQAMEDLEDLTETATEYKKESELKPYVGKNKQSAIYDAKGKKKGKGNKYNSSSKFSKGKNFQRTKH
jgi:hypothetical protein